MSVFARIEAAPPDPIFGVTAVYKASPLPEKALLTVGVYRDEDNAPFTFPSVNKAEHRIVGRFGHEYLPMQGYGPFLSRARSLLWSEALLSEIGGRIGTVQSCAGTGALYLTSCFTKQFLHCPKVLISDPYWPSYRQIFLDNSHELAFYPVIKNWSFDCDGACQVLENEPDGCLVVFQVCGHNPSGIDPTMDQWHRLFASCSAKKHIICFDFAYMGFASGDMDSDAAPVREYARMGREFFVAFSFSKCMGLYGERIGALHIVCKDEGSAHAVETQMIRIGRGCWSVCPQNGAYLAAEVMGDDELASEWQADVAKAAQRIIDIRNRLCDLLEDKTGKKWPQIRGARGMFAYTGLDQVQVKRLADEFGVFLVGSGRITIPCLNSKNVEFVANGIAAVSRKDNEM
jgi:aspartate/tyrosine/aromatic aminotransferase